MGYVKTLVLRCLARILDGQELGLVVEEAEDTPFVEGLWRALRSRYGPGGAAALAARLLRELEAEDPAVAERVRRAWRLR